MSGTRHAMGAPSGNRRLRLLSPFPRRLDCGQESCSSAGWVARAAATRRPGLSASGGAGGSPAAAEHGRRREGRSLPRPFLFLPADSSGAPRRAPRNPEDDPLFGGVGWSRRDLCRGWMSHQESAWKSSSFVSCNAHAETPLATAHIFKYLYIHELFLSGTPSLAAASHNLCRLHDLYRLILRPPSRSGPDRSALPRPRQSVRIAWVLEPPYAVGWTNPRGGL